MITQLLTDESVRPQLFHWNGAIRRADLDQWLLENQIQVPHDLVELWATTGGGDLFESETILGPHGNVELGDDVLSVNATHRARGLGVDFVLFHIGLGLSAVRLSDGKYVSLSEDDYRVTAEYSSLADWYERAIREEYAERYGLPLRNMHAIRG